MFQTPFFQFIHAKHRWWIIGSVVLGALAAYELAVLWGAPDRILFESHNVCARQNARVTCFLRRPQEPFFARSFVSSPALVLAHSFRWKNQSFLLFPFPKIQNRQVRLGQSFWIFDDTFPRDFPQMPLPKAVFSVGTKTIPKKFREIFAKKNIPVLQQKQLGNFLLQPAGDSFSILTQS